MNPALKWWQILLPMKEQKLTSELKDVFEERQAAAIAGVVMKAVWESQRELVKAGDFTVRKSTFLPGGRKGKRKGNHYPAEL